VCYTMAMVLPFPWIFRNAFQCTVLAVGAILSTTACATVQSHPVYQQGQIIDPALNTMVPFSEFRSALLGADVIYIGEAHYTPSHIEAGLQVLQTLLDEGRTPILGMEMFSWDGQAGLDRYLNGEVTTVKDFLTESQWKNNWGAYPTDDIDLILLDPNFAVNFEGATFSSPERVEIENPAAGEWSAFVQGFTIQGVNDKKGSKWEIQITDQDGNSIEQEDEDDDDDDDDEEHDD